MRSDIQYSNRSVGVLDQNNLPWLLTEQQSNDVKEVIQRIKFPTGFASNIKNILTKKGEFGGVKTHDWYTFIKVIILVYIFIYTGLTDLFYFYFYFCLSTLVETNNDSFCCYNMFYRYLSQTTLTTMSNKLYMILENK
jgi:hypothetical protein